MRIADVPAVLRDSFLPLIAAEFAFGQHDPALGVIVRGVLRLAVSNHAVSAKDHGVYTGPSVTETDGNQRCVRLGRADA